MQLAPLILIAGIAWLSSETLKYLIRRRHQTHVTFGDSGGMPSSHAAIMAAVSTVAGLQDGFDSSVFGLALVLTGIVAHDAVRLRGLVGQQAVRLNELIAASKLPNREPLYVWYGHRIREVAVGLVFGSALAVVLYYAYNVLLVTTF